MFLHHGVFHILSNCYFLTRIGPLAEGAYGRERFLLLYLLSGVGGNLFGLWFGPASSISVGASGAVFGLMGAVGAYALRNKKALGRSSETMLQGVGQVLFLNLLIGLQPRSGVDNLAHVGGCASGALLGLVLSPDLADARSGRRDETGVTLAGRLLLRAVLLASLAATAWSINRTLLFTRMLGGRLNVLGFSLL